MTALRLRRPTSTRTKSLGVGDVVFNKMRMWQGAVRHLPRRMASSVLIMLSRYQPERCCPVDVKPALSNRAVSVQNVRDGLTVSYGIGSASTGEVFAISLVPLPSIDTQQMIVEHVTEATAKVDALVSAAEDVIALLRERRGGAHSGGGDRPHRSGR